MATISRNRPWPRRLKWVAIALVGLYLLICVGMYFLQESLVFRPTVLAQDAAWDLSLPDSVKALEASHEEVFFESGLDGRVNGLHFRRDSSRGVLLFVHGNGGNNQNYLWRRTDFLARGYDFFIFDYRGYGKSTGPVSEAGLDADCEAAYQYLLQHYPENRIVVFGQSLGSGFAVRMAAKHHPRFVFLETPYTSLADVGAHDFPWLPVRLLMRYPSESEAHVGEIDSPMAIIHGTADEVIPYEMGQAMAKAAIKANLITCEGAGHNGCSKTPAYQEMLDGYLH